MRAERTIKNLYPPAYNAIHRAIITTGGRQFTCDGLVAVSPAEGHHLAVASTFGVVTDLRVNDNLGVELLKVTPLFRADWSREFVGRDLGRLFVPPSQLQPAGLMADGRLVLQSAPDSAGLIAQYVFSADGSRWQELDLVRNGEISWRAVVKHYLKFPATAAEVPDEFEVRAPSYTLDLRVAAMTMPSAKKESAP